MVGDHLLHLVRHAGHRVHDLAVGQLTLEPGRGADRVRDRLTPVGDIGLAQVVLRHVPDPGAEHLGDRLRELVVTHQRDTHELCDRIAGQVVLGRAETAADEHGVGPLELIAQRGDDAGLVVADRAMLERVDARRRELFPDPRTVRVDDLTEQQLGADREDLTPHLVTFPSVAAPGAALLRIRCVASRCSRAARSRARTPR